MLLIIAIGVLGLVVVAGAWLGGQYILRDEPPTRRWPGYLHGAAGLAGFAVLVVALSGAPRAGHAVRMGAGAFGQMSAALIAGALLVACIVLLLHARRRAVPLAVIATHGLLGIGGYTVLVTYLTMLH